MADQRRAWLDGAEYALSELGVIEAAHGRSAPFGSIVISEKTGLALRLTARSEPGHGSMPWRDTAPHRLIRALTRLLEAERPPRVLPEIQEYFARMASVMPPGHAEGYESLEQSLRDPAFRARFFANRHHAALVRTTFAVNMLKGSEKRNVIPPEAVADIDCRVLAGEDPEEIMQWVRRVIADPQVEVSVTSPPKVPNLSPPDTELYKGLSDALKRRAPGAVVAPEIMVGFTDNWVSRLSSTPGFGPSCSTRRVAADPERTDASRSKPREGARCYTELLLQMAAA